MSVDEITVTIGGRTCTQLRVDTPDPDVNQDACSSTSALTCEKRLRCITPPGVGSTNEVIISIGSDGASEAASRGNWMILQYRAPQIEAIFADLPPLDQNPATAAETSYYPMGLTSDHAASQSETAGVPTTGGVIELRGSGFGTAEYAIAEATIPGKSIVLAEASARASDGVLRLVIPEGLGHSHVIQLQVGSRLTDMQVANSVDIRYARPRVTGAAPQALGTSGGELVTIRGRDYGADVSMDQVQVQVGGRPCEIVAGSMATLHNELQCFAPVHTGRNLPVEVTVAGQSSDSKERGTDPAGIRVSYRPPMLLSASPLSGPTSGRTPDGNPYTMRLHGSNFGDGN